MSILSLFQEFNKFYNTRAGMLDSRGQKFLLSPRVDEWILERTSDSPQSARPTGRVLKSAGETSISEW